MANTMTKEQFRTLVRTLLGDVGKDRIGDPALDVVTQVVHDREWAGLLYEFPYLVTQNDALTALTTPGYVDLRESTDSGDLTKRLYRILAVVRDGQTYRPLSAKQVARQPSNAAAEQLVGSNVGTTGTYVQYGTQLHLFPYDTTTDVDVLYSYLPTRYTSLAETAAVGWPDGGEYALASAVMATVTKALGDRALADDALRNLRADVARRTANSPTLPIFDDTPQQYGAE